MNPMPITKCETCGTAVTRPPSQMRNRIFCSKTCAYAGLTKAEPTARRMLWRPNHILAGAKGYIAEHRAILFDKIGFGPHLCHWCSKPIHWTSQIQATSPTMIISDHVDTDPFNNTPENLVPSCQGCNATRWHKVADNEPHVVNANGSRRRGVTKTCLECGHTFVAVPDPRPGRGLYCSLSCARKKPRKTSH